MRLKSKHLTAYVKKKERTVAMVAAGPTKMRSIIGFRFNIASTASGTFRRKLENVN